MPGKIKKIGFALLSLVLFGLHACSGGAPQISGIVAISNIETVACEAREKTLRIRNNDTSEPQRIQGVQFELGTNSDKWFKILSVTANGRTKEAVGNLVEEIILPPGGSMEILVQYKPRVTTPEGEYHATWVDVYLNGPKLGVMQIELRGTAPTAKEGCTNDTTGGRTFEVLAVKTILSHTGLGAPVETDLDVNTDVEGNLVLNGSEDAVTIAPSGWPTITFPLPDGAPLPELNILLDEETGPTDFSAGALNFEDVTLSSPGVGAFPGLTLTTGSITIDSSVAPQVSGGSLTVTGSDLDDQGEMTLVTAAALTRPPVDTVDNVGGGVFALVITVKEVQ